MLNLSHPDEHWNAALKENLEKRGVELISNILFTYRKLKGRNSEDVYSNIDGSYKY
jgi:hypothetical protein